MFLQAVSPSITTLMEETVHEKHVLSHQPCPVFHLGSYKQQSIGSVPGTTRKPRTSRLPPIAPEPVLLFPYSPIPLAVLGPCTDVTTTHHRIAGAIGSVCPRPRMRKNNWLTTPEQTSCDHTTRRPLYTLPGDLSIQSPAYGGWLAAQTRRSWALVLAYFTS